MIRLAYAYTKFFTVEVAGVGTAADSTPTATLYRNGAASGVAVTVTATATTGLYKATFTTLGAGDEWAATDVLHLIASATIDSTANYLGQVWDSTSDPDGSTEMVATSVKTAMEAEGSKLATVESTSGAAKTAAESADGKLTAGRLAKLDRDLAAVGDQMTIDMSQATPGLSTVGTQLDLAGTGEGSSGVADWTATEREQIRWRLGIDGTESAPVVNTDHHLVIDVAAGSLSGALTFPIVERDSGQEKRLDFTWPIGSATITAEVSVDGAAKVAAVGVVSAVISGEDDLFRYALSYNAADYPVGSGSSVFHLTDGTWHGEIEVQVTEGVIVRDASVDDIAASILATPDNKLVTDASGFVTAGTVGDKTGYSLTQSFPDNFASLGINAGGDIDRVTLVDTTTVNTDMRGTDSAALASAWTSTRAGYIDNLNVGGNVASQADVQSVTQASRVRIAVPPQMDRPSSGNTSYRIWIYNYDETHKADDLDSLPVVSAEDHTGTDLSIALGVVTKQALTTGIYYVDYMVDTTDSTGAVLFKVDATEGGETTQYIATSSVVDAVAVDFTSGDRAKLDALYGKLPTAGYLLGSASSNGSGYATPANVTAAQAAIIAQGDAEWSTADVSELATASSVAALNDLGTGDIDARLALYDGPTKAEMDAAFAALNDLSTADIDARLAFYDGPTKTEMDTAIASVITQGNSAWATANVSDLATAASITALNDLSTSDIDGRLEAYDAVKHAEIVSAFNEIKGATWSATTDTLEALRNRGDTAWATADVSALALEASVAALNDLSTADVDARLAAYDAPTKSELDAAQAAIISQGNAAWATADVSALATADSIDALNDLSTADIDARLAAYDGPTYAELVAAFSEIKGPTFDTLTDSLESLRDRGDAAWTTADVSALASSASIAALNNLSTADIDARLAAYDAPTKAELDAARSAIIDHGDTEWSTADVSSLATAADVSALNNLSTSDIDSRLAAYDAPTKAELDAAFAEIKGGTWSSLTDTLEAIRDRGDAAWTTAVGYATPADVTAAQATIIARGDLAWATAVGFAEPGDLVGLTQEAIDAILYAAVDGTREITFSATDSTSTAVQGVKISILTADGNETRKVVYTGTNGTVIAHLEDGDYITRITPPLAYEAIADAPLGVNGDATVPIAVVGVPVTSLDPDKCLIRCRVMDAAGVVVEGAVVEAIPVSGLATVSTGLLAGVAVSATTNAAGYCEMELPRSSTINSSGSRRFKFTVTYAGKSVFKSFEREIPDTDSEWLEVVLNTSI